MAPPTTLKEAMAALSASGEAPALSPSRLGSKDHWDEVYTREVKNFADFGDEGDVWFGEDSAEKMVDWMLENAPPTPELRVVDVGCGNGHLLILLSKAGYTNLTGIDYSEASIDVARAIALKHGETSIKWEVRDIFKGAREGDAWDVVLDKGTFDGISLSDELIEGKTLAAHYPSRISEILRPDGGIFLITSCNWTRPELEKKYVGDETGFKYFSHIPRPTFSFGGAGGQTITTIAFARSQKTT